MQHHNAGIDVENLNAAGKLPKRLFPVGVASNDQRRLQAFGGLLDDACGASPASNSERMMSDEKQPPRSWRQTLIADILIWVACCATYWLCVIVYEIDVLLGESQPPPEDAHLGWRLFGRLCLFPCFALIAAVVIAIVRGTRVLIVWARNK